MLLLLLLSSLLVSLVSVVHGQTNEGALYQPAGYQTAVTTTSSTTTSGQSSSFAAAVAWNPNDSTLFVTGATYETTTTAKTNVNANTQLPSCFIAQYQLPEQDEGTITLINQQIFEPTASSSSSQNEVEDVAESCNGIVLAPPRGGSSSQSHELLLTGLSQRHGLLEPFYTFPIQETKQFGMLLDVRSSHSPYNNNNNNNETATGPFQLVGGRLMQDATYVFPQAITFSLDSSTPPTTNQQGDNNDKDNDENAIQTHVYVASLVTDNRIMDTNDGQEGEEKDLSDVLNAFYQFQPDPAEYIGFGTNTNFQLQIKRYQWTSTTTTTTASSTSLQETLQEDWSVVFGTIEEGHELHVSALLHTGTATTAAHSNLLVVAGYTTGHGAGLGVDIDQNDNDDVDGFITKVSAKEGYMMNHNNNIKNNNTTTTTTTKNTVGSVRIQSLNGQDDWIHGMCHSPRDPSHIYVVGSTAGYLAQTFAGSTNNKSIQAFLLKLDTSTLDTVWVQQWGATTTTATSKSNDSDDYESVVQGMSCALSPDGEVVWMGANIQHGAMVSLAGITQSYGQDDIVVSKVLADTGKVEFNRQIGTAANDVLAVHRSLVTDSMGNAIVVGNTYGSLYRQRNSDNDSDNGADVFITTIQRYNGQLAPTVQQQQQQPNNPPVQPPIATTASPTTAPTPSTNKSKGADDEEEDDPSVVPTTTTTTTSAHSTKRWVGLVVLLMFLIAGTLVYVLYGQQYTLWTFCYRYCWCLCCCCGDNKKDGKDGSAMYNLKNHDYAKYMTSGSQTTSSSSPSSASSSLLSPFFGRQRRRGESSSSSLTERSKVLDYLVDFDVENVDLKHSATGGWHCAYTGELAHGRFKNNKILSSNNNNAGIFSDNLDLDDSPYSQAFRDDPLSPRSLTNDFLTTTVPPPASAPPPLPQRSSDQQILQSSLFMDDGNDNNNNNRTGTSTTKSLASVSSSSDGGYDHLVHAYNSTWDDRRTTAAATPATPSPPPSIKKKKTPSKQHRPKENNNNSSSSSKNNNPWGSDII